MFHGITVEKMNKAHINDLVILWKSQFLSFCCNTDMFSFLENNIQNITEFIEKHGGCNKGVVAKLDNQIVGYLAYDTFDFHGNISAFIPFAGNAARLENRDNIYLSLYKSLAQDLVSSGIYNHYITINTTDHSLRNRLFDLGFGSYVIDAFSNFKSLQAAGTDEISIQAAALEDSEELFELVKESDNYYLSSPIFLKRDAYTLDDVINLIKSGKVYIAKHLDKMVGFINLSIARYSDVISMCSEGFGQIDEIGAYIKEEYRNKNIGRQLLGAIADYCEENRVPCVHVDYESANLYGNRFWRKYFTPVMISMKRTIHEDAYPSI